jgi:excisionase family DNA binding protein
MAKDQPILSVAQAAAALRVTDRQVLNLIKGGLLPAERLGRAFMIRREDLANVPKVRKPGPKPKAGAEAKADGKVKPPKAKGGKRR